MVDVGLFLHFCCCYCFGCCSRRLFCNLSHIFKVPRGMHRLYSVLGILKFIHNVFCKKDFLMIGISD